jgi:signal transduction histidine kinase
MTTHSALAPRTRQLARFGQRGLLTLAAATVVALFLALLPGRRFVPTLVYTACIALACWLFIDGGRLLTARWVHRHASPALRAPRGEWPGWGWMSAVLSLGTLAGYGLGHELASRVLGEATPRWLAADLPSLAAIVALSMIPGLAATYFFSSRAHLAASRAQAERAERLAAEQRLKLLASQLEPHMLFNTLANLRALIGVDPLRAQTMLDRLIVFLRATLDASRGSTHPLAAEYARLDDYLELMQIRMGTRLQTRLTLPDDLADRQVPVLLLQPLVENAIKHGLEPHVHGGCIDVSATHEGTQLVLRVRDTGAGPAPAASGRTAGFGIEQVRERLSTLYGPAASLELAAAPGVEGGTLATLRMPL